MYSTDSSPYFLHSVHLLNQHWNCIHHLTSHQSDKSHFILSDNCGALRACGLWPQGLLTISLISPTVLPSSNGIASNHWHPLLQLSSQLSSSWFIQRGRHCYGLKFNCWFCRLIPDCNQYCPTLRVCSDITVCSFLGAMAPFRRSCWLGQGGRPLFQKMWLKASCKFAPAAFLRILMAFLKQGKIQKQRKNKFSMTCRTGRWLIIAQ